MKTKLLLFFIFFSCFLSAQESNDKTVYLDSLNKETSVDNYIFKRVIKDYYKEQSEYQYLDYYKSGTLKSNKKLSGKDGGFFIGEEINYYENGNKKNSSFYENKKLNGKHKEWYEDGKIREEGNYNSEKFNTKEHYLVETIWDEKGVKMVENGNGMYEANSDKIHEKGEYKNGMKNGIWTLSSGKKSISYFDEYKDGEFVYGYSIDKNGIKKDYTAVEKKPIPKKGLQDFYQYIGSHFKYTRESIKNKIQGKIFLKFVIDRDGKIVEAAIVRGLGYGLDEEAIRVVTSYENWHPGEQRGISVRCLYTLPLTLKAE